MDYEKLHKDTINRLQQMVSCGKITVEVAREICADFIPESEDEKIRKVIYGWIYTQPSQFFDNGFSKEEMLAWLEKQGEQKPAEEYNITGIGSKKAQGKLGEMIKKLKGEEV